MGDSLKKKLLNRHVIPVAVGLILIVFSIAYGKYYSKSEIMEQTENCLMCHDDKAESLAGSPHQLAGKDDLPSAISVGCIECHAGWEKHIEDPGPENITMGPELGTLKQAEICSGCHQNPHQAAMITTDPHGRNDLNCSSCHTIHSNPNHYLVKDDGEDYCLQCHSVVKTQFEDRSRHPLMSGNIHCVDCHKFGDTDNPTLTQGLDWVCQDCHSDKAGPHIYEHPVTYSYLVNGSGCTECHSPHGSPNDMLLRQAGSGTCKQCHMVPPGHRTRHGGLGASYACTDCHTEVHGSNSNRLFLDPDLGMKMAVNCFNAGCHSLEK